MGLWKPRIFRIRPGHFNDVGIRVNSRDNEIMFKQRTKGNVNHWELLRQRKYIFEDSIVYYEN
jgi:hypothetical protein